MTIKQINIAKLGLCISAVNNFLEKLTKEFHLEFYHFEMLKSTYRHGDDYYVLVSFKIANFLPNSAGEYSEAWIEHRLTLGHYTCEVSKLAKIEDVRPRGEDTVMGQIRIDNLLQLDANNL